MQRHQYKGVLNNTWDYWDQGVSLHLRGRRLAARKGYVRVAHRSEERLKIGSRYWCIGNHAMEK
jgi:hypothetical protein